VPTHRLAEIRSFFEDYKKVGALVSVNTGFISSHGGAFGVGGCAFFEDYKKVTLWFGGLGGGLGGGL
jgi:hypothetical protein